MLGATCYAHRHPDLLRSFCGGSLETCDVDALRTHFESDAGQRAGRRWGCEGLGAANFSNTSSIGRALGVALRGPAAFDDEMRDVPPPCRRMHESCNKTWVAAPERGPNRSRAVFSCVGRVGSVGPAWASWPSSRQGL